MTPKKETLSIVFSSTHLVETVFSKSRMQFAVWQNNQLNTLSKFKYGNLEYEVSSEIDRLLKHEVVSVSEKAIPYINVSLLKTSIKQFIRQYIDLTEDEELMSTYYVLLTWVYDAFDQVPYLRKTGDYGTGKSRFLKTLGSISYKGIFASGASTISPIFHLLDTVQGTLILDEADFTESDSKSLITKILNNGFMKGFPVLRSTPDKLGAYSPKSFRVYGCKILATRSFFQDNALESRFITFHSKLGKLRDDIPISLPPSFEKEALELRNMLLMFRFKNYQKYLNMRHEVELDIEPRLKQILQPLFCLMIDDSEATAALTRYALSMQQEINQDRSSQIEARVLKTVKELWDQDNGSVTIKKIANLFQVNYSQEYRRKITYRWIGSIIRKVLGLKTTKSNGLYTICATEAGRLDSLYKRFGV